MADEYERNSMDCSLGCRRGCEWMEVHPQSQSWLSVAVPRASWTDRPSAGPPDPSRGSAEPAVVASLTHPHSPSAICQAGLSLSNEWVCSTCTHRGIGTHCRSRRSSYRSYCFGPPHYPSHPYPSSCAA